MAATIEHTNLGKIQGKSSNGVTQYLGIKYGYLKDRFAEATMAEPTATTDATKIGSVHYSQAYTLFRRSVVYLY